MKIVVKNPLFIKGRITPRQALEAFERTGLTPERGIWYKPGMERGDLACAITAIAFDTTSAPKLFNVAFPSGFVLTRDMYRAIGISRDYASFFIEGFDFHESQKTPDHIGSLTREERLGLLDGIRASRFVFGRKGLEG